MEGVIEFVGRVLGKVFGTQNERDLRRFWTMVRERINPLEEEWKSVPDAEFPTRIAAFRERCRQGEPLDDFLPEVFAACREAARRTVNMRHFDVQMIGGMVLHEGKIAEMATGEGKTLVATLAASLNALEGKGVHVVTVNDYLARRDTQWMGPIYDFLGLSVASIQHDEAFLFDKTHQPEPENKMRHLRPITRREAYRADITYGTNNEFGFDYLRDNMKVRVEDLVQREYRYAIVDEVDSILIDEARTPLIISGPSEESVDKYYEADRIARRLRPGEDYEVKEKEHVVVLTEGGIEKAERMAGVDSFYSGEHMDWPHFLEQALRAHNLYRLDRDYVIKDGEVIIVDEFTGRLMPGRRWSDGLHQAVEAKETIKIREETQTLATITLQNYFKMYAKLAGMTGTASTEAAEFEKIYKLGVVVIPTNKIMKRLGMPDVVYGSEREKYDAIEEEIAKTHETGRPILVGTTSIEKSEILSERLKMRGVPHEVLNAKHHEREASIVSKAGQRGNVTIATNMAGRGTDIVLGDGVADLGGLHVMGTERHEARRIDNQLRGRTGRQGDPGSSQFFLSLEDDLFRKFAPPWIRAAMVKMGLKDGQAIESGMVSRSIEKAQKNVEARNFDIRKNLLEYDMVMNEQRKVIYGLRRKILEETEIRETVFRMMSNRVYDAVDLYAPDKTPPSEWQVDELAAFANNRLTVDVTVDDVRKCASRENVEKLLIGAVERKFAQREQEVGAGEAIAIARFILMSKIDEKWKDHLYNMDQLRSSVGLRGYGQLDPKLEYKREGAELFRTMMAAIEEEVTALVFRVAKAVKDEERLGKRWRATEERKDDAGSYDSGETAAAAQSAGATDEKPRPIVAEKKTARNDPCPCGSGKKYKKCCGK